MKTLFSIEIFYSHFRCNGTDPKQFASTKCQHSLDKVIASSWLQMGFEVATENINLQRILSEK